MRALWVGLTALVALGTASTFAQEPSQTFIFTGYEWYADNITFEYRSELADTIVTQWFAATSDPNVPEGILPETSLLKFERYDQTEQMWKTNDITLNIYPISTFPSVDQPAGQTLAALTTLLALPDADLQTALAAGNLPTMSQLTNSQVLVAQPRPVSFKNGRGIAYLTAGAQDASPLVNGQLSYVFEGITNDSQYYVSFDATVSTPLLPDQIGTDFDYNAFSASYETYITDLETALNAASPSDFTPNLELLDPLLITTLQITAPTAVFPTGDISYNGISFTVDQSLAYRVEVDDIAGYDSDDGLFGRTPRYTQFTLVGYPVQGQLIAPSIYVYNIADITPDTPYASEAALLQSQLTAKPALGELLSFSSITATAPAHLPVFNASQVMVLKPAYLTFASGDALRYVTYYSQGVDFISSDGLFYTFQGLSSDGNRIVVADLPLNAPGLEKVTYPYSEEQLAILQDYDTYINATFATLQAITPEQWTPTLSALDNLFSTLSIE